MNAQKTTVREAFDRHAGAYDELFSGLCLAQQVRSDVWRIADSVFPQAARLIDAGCGTGEDAVHFAQNRCRVTAFDISAEMVSKLETKVRVLGLEDRIDSRVADVDHITPDSCAYDGIYSNFGVLNCLSDLSGLRRMAVGSLKPGGHLVLVTMGSFYPLESAIYLLKGHPAKAFRRLKRPARAVLEGVGMEVFYHRPRAIGRALGPSFERKIIQGLRSVLPAPGLEHLDKFPMFRLLTPLDRVITAFAPTAAWADHVITVWQFRP